MAEEYTIRRHVIEEHRSSEGGRLGRHVMHDSRSKDYPAEGAKALKEVHHSYAGLPLDQARGSCTAEAFCGAANTDPNRVKEKQLYVQQDADNLYDREIILEGGNPATDDPGGTGLMVCRAARQLGWVREYRHAFGIDHALSVLTLRPVMFGSNWYEGFDRPDSSGVVHVAGQVRGGHEYVAVGMIPSKQLIECVQSWGAWGLNGGGKFYVPFGDMDRLLHEDGDCTVPYL